MEFGSHLIRNPYRNIKHTPPNLQGWRQKAVMVSEWMMKTKKSPKEAAYNFRLRPDTILKMTQWYLRRNPHGDYSNFNTGL